MIVRGEVQMRNDEANILCDSAEPFHAEAVEEEMNRKQYQDAARDLEAYSGSHPDFAYAHYYAGMAYNGMKRPDKMLTHFEMFVRMKPEAPEARRVRSVLQSGR